MQEGKIDLGFFEHLCTFNNEYNIEMIPIKKEQLVLITSKNHPFSTRSEISLKELKEESFIVCSESDKKIMLQCCLKIFGYTPKISLEPTEVSMIEGLVAAGAGVAIVSHTPSLNTNQISIINIKEKIGESTIYMGWHKDSYISPITKKFKEYVINTIELL